MANDVTRGKFLSLVLRHAPSTLGLSLNVEGWISIDDILMRAPTELELDRTALERIVNTNDKRRFTISSDGQKIRANQGHSVPVDLGLEPQKPPPVLFHGTATRFIDSILNQGLVAGERQHVHLTNSEPLAIQVGERHGRSVVLEVAADAMSEDGLHFWLSENGVWLTVHVPVKYLRVLPK